MKKLSESGMHAETFIRVIKHDRPRRVMNDRQALACDAREESRARKVQRHSLAAAKVTIVRHISI